MKAVILATTIVLGATSYATAADFVEDSVYDWSGIYVGVFEGWANNRTKATDITGEEYGDSTAGATMSL